LLAAALLLALAVVLLALAVVLLLLAMIPDSIETIETGGKSRHPYYIDFRTIGQPQF
jgi:hypothetical protein